MDQNKRRFDEIKARVAALAGGIGWSVEEDDRTWVLRAGLRQILKAPKRGTVYAEYWPDAAEADVIVNAPADIAWLCMELTSAANLIMRQEQQIKGLQADHQMMRASFDEERRWRQKEYGKMAAKIGQARAEAALARERLRTVTAKYREAVRCSGITEQRTAL